MPAKQIIIYSRCTLTQSSAFLLGVGGFEEQGFGMVGFGVKNRILYGGRKEDLVKWDLRYGEK